MAYKVITGIRTPEHSTIAEFRRRHETEIGELFDDVLGLCREAGLVSVGVITIDGTKLKANASMDQNRSYRELVTEILREAEETDRREDELYGDSRGDELPEPLRIPEGRRQALADAKRRLAERKARPVDEEPVAEMEWDLEASVLARPVLRRGGRREWFRVARSELGAHRARQAQPIPRDREDRRSACSNASTRTSASTRPRTRPMSGGAPPPGIPRAGCRGATASPTSRRSCARA